MSDEKPDAAARLLEETKRHNHDSETICVSCEEMARALAICVEALRKIDSSSHEFAAEDAQTALEAAARELGER